MKKGGYYLRSPYATSKGWIIFTHSTVL